jgi:glycosyltransferase involved in cell wall biosynthesis
VSSLPHVSVCIPVYRSEPWIGSALESVLAQTYENFEIVVVDNQSPDRTTDVVRSFDDERIRLFVNPANLGPIVNHNRAVELARAPLIKILHADDTLVPTCLEKMVRVLDAHERVGFVFARRRIDIDSTADPHLIWFKNSSAEIHRGFRDLGRVNDGGRLFDEYLAAGLPSNWVGEQTAVMIRRECFERHGVFNERIWQLADMEMWARTMLAYDVGFVDEELVVYRFGHENLTASNSHVNRQWLDKLWLIETLLAQQPSSTRRSALTNLRRSEYLYVGKEMARLLRAPHDLGDKLRDLRAYAAHRTRTTLRPPGPPLVQQVPAVPA